MIYRESAQIQFKKDFKCKLTINKNNNELHKKIQRKKII